MRNTTLKSFEFAADVSKLLITLSTGIPTLSAALIREKIMLSSGFFLFSCVVLLVSAASGIFTLLQLAGILAQSPNPSIYNKGVTKSAALQIILFFMGLILMIVAIVQ